MKKLIVLAIGFSFCMVMAGAQERANHHSGSITMSSDAASDDCNQHLRMGSDYRTSVRDEETRTLPNQPLAITAARNGGIQVTTWDKPEFALKLCKQVAANDESTGRKMLAQTRLEVSGGKISVQTPGGSDDEDNFSVGTVLLVKAPRDANLNLSVHNGGVSLNGFSGTAEAHAQNGGISFKKSTGKLTAHAQNGGISIKDCGGDVTARVENGGLSITLPDRWEGKGLDAHTRNGGLVVAFPKTFNGGLEVAASDYTTIVCKDEACNAGERTWESGRKLFRIGGANPQVHASSENGGIVIKERRGESEL